MFNAAGNVRSGNINGESEESKVAGEQEEVKDAVRDWDKPKLKEQ